MTDIQNLFLAPHSISLKSIITIKLAGTRGNSTGKIYIFIIEKDSFGAILEIFRNLEQFGRVLGNFRDF